MMDELFQSLLRLQELDEQIKDARERLSSYDPQLEELEAPIVEVEREFEATRTRLDEMRAEIRRLERAAEEKRDRLQRSEERLEQVQNARQSAAVNVELDLIRTAVDADEGEALDLMERAVRTELKVDELEEKLEATREEIGPKRQEVQAERATVEDELAVLNDQRENQIVRLDPKAAKLYERIATGHTSAVIARLTEDGACGHCYGIIPIQRQSEIRRADAMIRCETCGVILYAES